MIRRTWEDRHTGRYAVICPGTTTTEIRTNNKDKAFEYAKRTNYRVYVWDYAAKMIVFRNWT